MNAAVIVATWLGLSVLLTVAMQIRVKRIVRARSPLTIAQRLRTERGPVVFRLRRGSDAVWSPRRSPVWGVQMVYGPGTAAYDLTDGAIRLRFEQPGGAVQEYIGPIPAAIDNPALVARLHSLHRIRTVLSVVYLAGGLVGVVIGWLDNHDQASRPISAIAGGILGLAATYFICLLLVVPALVKRAARRASSSTSAADQRT